MKKVLGVALMSLVCLLPIVSKAETIKLGNPVCSGPDASGVYTCTVGEESDTVINSLTVTLKEQGGAEILSVDNASETDWKVSSQAEANGVWTVKLTAPDVKGEANLFTFKYKSSGTADCKILVGLGQNEVPVVPNEAPQTPANPDKTTENKQTGSTLPYIALGSVALIAIGAYMVTRNKAKMYRI